MKTDNKTLNEIIKLHQQYVKDIDESGMKQLSANIYKVNSLNFIRWIQNDFQPGSKIKSKM